MPITRVNSVSITGRAATSTATATIPAGTGILAGDVIFVCAASNGTHVLNGQACQDSVNLTSFPQIDEQQAGGGSAYYQQTFIFQTPADMADGSTITLTGYASATSCALAVDIFRGASTTLDQAVVSTTNATSTTPAGPALGTAATAGTLVLTTCSTGATGTVTHTVGSPYTAGSTQALSPGMGIGFVLAAPGGSTEGSTWTLGVTSVSATQTMSFQPAGPSGIAAQSARGSVSRLRRHWGIYRQLDGALPQPPDVTPHDASPTAGLAAATGAAFGGDTVPDLIQVTALPAAGLATGAAFKPSWGPGPGAALATGASFNPVAQVTAIVAGVAIASAASYDITQFGIQPGAALATGVPFKPAWGPGSIPATASAGAFAPFISYTAGAALGTGAASKPGWGPGTLSAAAAGTAQQAAASLTAKPAVAPATGTPLGPVELSPALEGFGFGTFPQVPANSVILSVVATVVWNGSNTGIQGPFYELWDGTSARIGPRMPGTPSVVAGYRDSIVFTGVTYSQLATLRLRIYATSLLVNAGATASFDACSLSVSWAPATNVTVLPDPLAVVPVFPAVAVSNGITTVAGAAQAAATAYDAFGTGAVNAAVLPAVLAVVPVFPAAAVSVGQSVLAGVLAVVPAFPAIPDVTGPGWAASDDQPVGGTGSWVNPNNILGSPDSSFAVWTAV